MSSEFFDWPQSTLLRGKLRHKVSENSEKEYLNADFVDFTDFFGTKAGRHEEREF